MPQAVTPHVHLKPNSTITRFSQPLGTNYLVQNYKNGSHPATTLHSHHTLNNTSATGSPGSKLQQLIAHHPTNFSQMKPSVKLTLNNMSAIGGSGSKLQQLITHHPTNFSQMKPTVKLTLNNTSATGSPGSKLQQLIAHHPTTFSQMKPSVELMLQAYGGSSGSKGGETVEDYTWSEVFPVARQCSSHRRSVSLPAVLCPLLASVQSGTQAQGKDGAVKLPKIALSEINHVR